jgi:hypothetical protein
MCRDQLIPQGPRDRDHPRLDRVPELSVTVPHPGKPPPIAAQQPEDIAELHRDTMQGVGE